MPRAEKDLEALSPDLDHVNEVLKGYSRKVNAIDEK